VGLELESGVSDGQEASCRAELTSHVLLENISHLARVVYNLERARVDNNNLPTRRGLHRSYHVQHYPCMHTARGLQFIDTAMYPGVRNSTLPQKLLEIRHALCPVLSSTLFQLYSILNTGGEEWNVYHDNQIIAGVIVQINSIECPSRRIER
jgi:hypothetical protein